jgi:sigma-B regulation protein RsbU (phosphoserine phosphatase)
VAYRFEPAEGVLAGDWMETIRLDEHRVGVIVVDVSGHGPEAGLRALLLKHLLVPALKLELDPADALHWVSGQIGETDEWFATCVIFEVNAATGRCLYANAGHPSALLLGPRGLQELPPTGPLFSDLPGMRWETVETTLDPDEVLVVYTDGITEARSDLGEEYGEARLRERLLSAPTTDVEALADRVMDSVHDFGAHRLSDDATLVLTSRPRVHIDIGSMYQRGADATR